MLLLEEGEENYYYVVPESRLNPQHRQKEANSSGLAGITRLLWNYLYHNKDNQHNEGTW